MGKYVLAAVSVVIVAALVIGAGRKDDNPSRETATHARCNSHDAENTARFEGQLALTRPPWATPGTAAYMQSQVVSICMDGLLSERDAFRTVLAMVCASCKD
jgi:hypothetical protein